MIQIRSLIVLAAGLAAPFAHAATTTYNFGSGSGASVTTGAAVNGIANSAGKAFQNSVDPAFAGAGTIAFGYFNITDAAITAATSSATLITAFQNWNVTAGLVGVTSQFAAPGPGATSNRGVFTFNANARNLQTTGGTAAEIAFQDKNMYAFIGNGLTYAASTEFLIIKTNYTFDAAQSGITVFQKPLTYAATSSILVGTAVANVYTNGADATAGALGTPSATTPGWQTAALVPEPSAALLGAIGALGLLRRRRI